MLDLLTGREREIIARLARGQTGKEVAFDLGISHVTVRVLLNRARLRLGVASKSELLALPAVRALASPEPAPVGDSSCG